MEKLTPFDIAHAILERTGETSAMKMQKLLYYCQAWSLVWDEQELFSEDFEAWANGPVLPCVYNCHRGQFKVSKLTFPQGSSEKVNPSQLETIEAVLGFYGDKTAQWLSNLTHQESPWRLARGDLPDMHPSSEPITKGSMEEYYSAL